MDRIIRIQVMEGVVVEGEETLCLALSVWSNGWHLADEDHLVRTEASCKT